MHRYRMTKTGEMTQKQLQHKINVTSNVHLQKNGTLLNKRGFLLSRLFTVAKIRSYLKQKGEKLSVIAWLCSFHSKSDLMFLNTGSY